MNNPPAHAVTGAGGIDSEETWGVSDVSGVACLGWLVEGYLRAYRRFLAAVDRRDAPAETFIPLFETLNWAASTSDYLSQYRKESHELLRAIRFARNRVHHQWALALEGRDVPWPAIRVALGSGRGRSGVVSPPVVLDWYWVPIDRLPAPDPKHPDLKSKRRYHDDLADRPVRTALEELAAFLASLTARTGT